MGSATSDLALRQLFITIIYVYVYIYAYTVLSEKARIFKALANDTRLTIVGYLLRNEHCACDFSGTKKDQTTVSRHLKVLTEAGIVKFKKNGRNIVYSIANDEMLESLRAMKIEEKENCCEPRMPSGNEIKQTVRKKYSKIALEGGGCGCGSGCCGNGHDPIQISSSLGYSEEDMNGVPEANLGLGCGNPGALGSMREGETVLDLGSGAGMDAFLAANRVGPKGKVIGVDFTEEMIQKARKNAKDNGFSNVEFRLGDIEDLPIDSGTVDLVMSNCVINLVPDKAKAFREAFRVLKPGGRMYISDIVLLDELTAEQRADEDLISGCVGGAVLKTEYIGYVIAAGFRIEGANEDKDISERQYAGLPVESLKLVATKPAV